MAQQWQFIEDAQHLWHWKHVDNEEESADAFPSETACMLDAVRTVVQRRREQAEIDRKKLLQ